MVVAGYARIFLLLYIKLNLLEQNVNCCFSHISTSFAYPPRGDFDGMDKTYPKL